ncbi:MAG: aldo/keto reductase [Gammaproteobacteria bacterium]|nr:aldo/keto reductase [Gammaproteobacteria bacterium]
MTPTRPYGSSGLQLSALGLGAGQLGDARLSEDDAAGLLAASLDAGVTLIDTAPSYGLSEQRIGRHLSTRRREAVISTKLGYGVEGIPDWTGPCIIAGVDQALRVLRTDYLDIAHLHSCPWTVLAQGEVVDALERAKQSGKVRAIAYSGENEDLDYAVGMDRFDGFMASLNLFDQRVIDRILPRITDKGFIAKRPSANHPWRFDAPPVGDYCETYWQRWQAMGLDGGGMAWGQLAIRFALSIPGVSSAIVGTARTAHLLQNRDWAMAGPLDPETVASWRRRFAERDQGWSGQI